MTRIKLDLRLLGALLVVVGFTGARPQPALAVDVVNGDAAVREIIVNGDNGESKIVKLTPHQKVTGVCQSCVVLLGNESVEASNADVVKISGGKVSVHSK